MNVFLPYPEDLVLSVRVLDDRRLMKQIVDTKLLLDHAICSDNKRRYTPRHAIAEHYCTQPEFLRYYGFICCCEYVFRFNELHEYAEKYFKPCDVVTDYTPIYVDGRIRTTENVGSLFRAKLIHKWSNKVIRPYWTKRKVPALYIRFFANKEVI